MSSIKRGHKGPAVTLAQGILKSLGYELDVDGDFGKGTFAAVESFQTDAGLGVDGIVGKKTAAALSEALNMVDDLAMDTEGGQNEGFDFSSEA